MLWIDSKYAAMLAPQLGQFKRIKDNVWNFRCPICGDSSKDSTKTRGYFFPHAQTLRYRCHNCGASSTFFKFLENFDTSLFQEYRLERFKELNSARQISKVITSTPLVKLPKKKKRPGLGFPSINDLPRAHPAVEYVLNRRIPTRHYSNIFYTDKMGEVADKIDGYDDTRFDEYPRILLPFIDANGTMTHIQGRAICPVPKSKRYITLELVENAPKVYGISTLDKFHTQYVVEGPLDSLFLWNCAGMGGADIDYNLFVPSSTVFVFDNEPRNADIIKRMNRTIERGFGVCIWGQAIVETDINEMILAGYTSGQIKNHIDANTFRGMKAKMAMVGYKKVSTTPTFRKQ